MSAGRGSGSSAVPASTCFATPETAARETRGQETRRASACSSGQPTPRHSTLLMSACATARARSHAARPVQQGEAVCSMAETRQPLRTPSFSLSVTLPPSVVKSPSITASVPVWRVIICEADGKSASERRDEIGYRDEHATTRHRRVSGVDVGRRTWEECPACKVPERQHSRGGRAARTDCERVHARTNAHCRAGSLCKATAHNCHIFSPRPACHRIPHHNAARQEPVAPPSRAFGRPAFVRA